MRNKTNRAKYRSKAPKIPKDKEKNGFGFFRQGVGGNWSAKVGSRSQRRISGDVGKEKVRTRTDNYRSGTSIKGSSARRMADQHNRNKQKFGK